MTSSCGHSMFIRKLEIQRRLSGTWNVSQYRASLEGSIGSQIDNTVTPWQHRLQACRAWCLWMEYKRSKRRNKEQRKVSEGPKSRTVTSNRMNRTLSLHALPPLSSNPTNISSNSFILTHTSDFAFSKLRFRKQLSQCLLYNNCKWKDA